MGHAKTVLVAAFAVLALAAPVMAQDTRNCAARETVLERLGTTYGETRRSMGLGANNAVVEVFASDESGSWTITITLPNGITCLVASGQAFEALADTPPPKGKGA
jgi:hypothetical protein